MRFRFIMGMSAGTFLLLISILIILPYVATSSGLYMFPYIFEFNSFPANVLTWPVITLIRFIPTLYGVIAGIPVNIAIILGSMYLIFISVSLGGAGYYLGSFID